jgi:hypothetical protein
MICRPLAVALACVLGLTAGQPAFARAAVTTDSCLKAGLCAYVSPKGRVTCGKCPGQVVKTVRLRAGVTTVCRDGSFSSRRNASVGRICLRHGGGGVRIPR